LIGTKQADRFCGRTRHFGALAYLYPEFCSSTDLQHTMRKLRIDENTTLIAQE